MRSTAVWIAAVIWATPATVVGDDAEQDPFAAARTAYEEAYDAIGRPDENRVDAPSLRAYPLYPYLQAARIEHDLASAGAAHSAADDAAARFVAAHDGEPVGTLLAGAWLDNLAARERWREFLDRYAVADRNARLDCLSFQARIALDETDGLAEAVAERWLTGRQLPAECEPAFQWLRDTGTLGDELTAQRVELLLENGNPRFARVIARRIAGDATALSLWADWLEHPGESIDRFVAGAGEAPEPAARLDAWSRFSRNRPAEALARYDPFMAALALGADERSLYARALALGLAWDRRSEALDLFAEVAAADLDDYALGWQARAALWASDWLTAEQAIAAMSAPERRETAWRYWSARAREALYGTEEAEAGYESILSDDNFYSAMAAARLGRRLAPTPSALDEDAARIAEIAAMPAFLRARELLRLELPVRALREWGHGYDALEPAAAPQSIHLAVDWGWYDVAVATATRHGIFNDYALLYPRPFEDEVTAAADFTGLDEDLIYATMRQESLYRSDASSSAGALGLMQLMPDTARIAARDWQQPRPSRGELFDPAVNTRLGAARLATLIDTFEGRVAVALAGYNAGPRAAERWLPEEPVPVDVWIENIPYNETRSYVRRVLWHELVFKALRTGRAQRLNAWLYDVAPESSDARVARR